MTDIKSILTLPLQKTPISAQCFDTIKPELKNHGLVMMKKTKVIPSRKTLPENIITNYHYLTLLGREISDNLALFSEKGLIPSWNIRHIGRGMSEDMDVTWEIAKTAGETKQYLKDFELLNEFFSQLAGQYLSQYQKNCSPDLQEVLKTILIIEYSLFTAEFITVANKQHTNVKTMRILTRKRNELLKYFTSEFSKYSNFEFDFKPFKEIWGKINRMDYNTSQKYLEERTILTN